MSWTPGSRRWSRMGSLGQLLREPPGSIRSRAKPSFAPASLALNLFTRSLLLCIRTCLRERTKPAVSPASRVGPTSRCSCFDLRTDKGSSPCVPPPSSSHLTAAFAPQLLLPTCRAISASPPPRGSRELTASGHHLHTSLLCASLPCIDLPPSSIVGHALASALPCLCCALHCSAAHVLLHPRARICHTLADFLCPRANRASSALRACSVQHLPTPLTSVRHRMHARATRSAPPTPPSCVATSLPMQAQQ
jgi:hypothetical protein